MSSSKHEGAVDWDDFSKPSDQIVVSRKMVDDVVSLVASIKKTISSLASSIPMEHRTFKTEALLNDLATKTSILNAFGQHIFCNRDVGRFTYFSFLPDEIREKIWALAVGPRVLEIQRERHTHRLGMDSNNPLPVTLFVNHESRTVALKQFLLFGGWHGTIDPKCYARFDPSSDTMFIPWSQRMNHLPLLLSISGTVLWFPEAMAKVQYLAIDWRTWGDAKRSQHKIDFTLFKSLQTLVVVLHQAHDEKSPWQVPCVEEWQRKQPERLGFSWDNKLLGYFGRRILREVKRYVLRQKMFRQIPKRGDFTTWEMPFVTVRYLWRGDKVCCQKVKCDIKVESHWRRR